MTRVVLICGVVTLFGAPHFSAEAADDFQTFAFTNVNVVPMDREHILRDQTVLVRDGRVSAIGPSSTTPVPYHAQRIAAMGKYLMPGLADMHVHFVGGEDGLVLFVANGVTTVRNVWGSPEHIDWRERVRRGSLFGPTIYTTRPVTDGDPPAWQGSAVVTTIEEAKQEVLEQQEAGYDGLEVYENLAGC